MLQRCCWGLLVLRVVVGRVTECRYPRTIFPEAQ